MGITMFDTLEIIHLLAAVGGYLFGAIPFGIVIARLFGLGDLRTIGSGNIGATNVLRTGNKLAALLTLLLDSGKGAIVVFVCMMVAIDDASVRLIGALAAVLGHNFPIWLKFKGGKGVATTLGVFLALDAMVGLAVCATWLGTAVILRYSSLAALTGLGLAPVYAWFMTEYEDLTLVAFLLAVLAFIRHHDNIRRLIRGEETKIGQKKKT